MNKARFEAFSDGIFAFSATDRMTVFLNLLLLAGTAFIPFATSVLGANPTLKSSTLLYGLTLSTIATFYNVMLNRLVTQSAPRGAVRWRTPGPVRWPEFRTRSRGDHRSCIRLLCAVARCRRSRWLRALRLVPVSHPAALG